MELEKASGPLGTSHELNDIFLAIQLSARLALKKLGSNQALASDLESIVKAAERGAALISDLQSGRRDAD